MQPVGINGEDLIKIPAPYLPKPKFFGIMVNEKVSVNRISAVMAEKEEIYGKIHRQ
ncbi:MAG: hypothetical protein K5695_13285 [Oscillospiraceae bacterium]|nr:hypothetical protein [Oscillospiraceae bacterium]